MCHNSGDIWDNSGSLKCVIIVGDSCGSLKCIIIVGAVVFL